MSSMLVDLVRSCKNGAGEELESMPENFSIRQRKPTSKGTDCKALVLHVSQPKGLEMCVCS